MIKRLAMLRFLQKGSSVDQSALLVTAFLGGYS
jgi:hypothetical protein